MHSDPTSVSPAGHPLFYSIRDENAKLYAQKHRMYATDADPMSNFRRCGTLIDKLLKPGVDRTLAAALTLMSKQVVGVYEIVGEQKANTVESLEDKLRDIEIYATICQVLLKEAAFEQSVSKNTDLLQRLADTPNKYAAAADKLKELGKQDVATRLEGYHVDGGPYCDTCDTLAELRSPHGVYFCRACVPITWHLADFTVLDGGKL